MATRLDHLVREMALHGLHPHQAEGPSVEIARRLALGEHPHDICPELRPVDARAYCRLTGFEAPPPLEWLAQRLPGGSGPPASIGVCYWVLDRLDSSRTRAAMLAAAPRIDELDDQIVRGAGRSVRRALALADDAAVMRQWSGPDLLVPDDRALDLARWPAAREMRTATDLVRLGRDQAHCVGQYCGQVHRGECRIVALHEGDRVVATAQLQRGRCVQIRGPRNEEAPAWCVAVASEIAAVVP